MKKLIFPIVLAFILFALSLATAENTPATRLSLKGLGGIGLRVQPIDPKAQRDGLSTRQIRAAVEARLRKAKIRLLTPEQQGKTLHRACLLVNVATSKLSTGEHLYSIHVEVTQWVATLTNPKRTVTTAIPVPAKTWSAPSVFGITPAKGIRQDAQEAVGAMVDEFIDAYYQANPGETALHAGRVGRLR